MDYEEFNDRIPYNSQLVQEGCQEMRMADVLSGHMLKEIGSAYLGDIVDKYGMDVANDLQFFAAKQAGDLMVKTTDELEEQGLYKSDGVLITAWVLAIYDMLLSLVGNMMRMSFMNEIDDIEKGFNDEQ